MKSSTKPPRIHEVEPDKLNNPIKLRGLIMNLKVEDAKELTDFVQVFGPLTFVGGRHNILIQNRRSIRLIMGKE